ncbi:outer membrane protein TolC [Paraburkholderia sp. GAS448]
MTILGSLVRTATSVAGAPSTLALVAGPSVSWNVFDHGKIMNNVRVR